MTASPDTAAPPSALPDLSDEPAVGERTFTASSPTLGRLASVEIEVTVEFGRRRLPLGDVARLDVGSLVVLDTLAGEPLVVYANGRRIATGEAVVVDGQFGIRIQHLVTQGDD